MITTNPEVLRLISSNVESVAEAKEVILELDKEFEKHPTAVGLAAIQVHIAKRVAIVKFDGKRYELINPVVIEKEHPFINRNEGCLSFPNEKIDTMRYEGIVIDNNVIEGDSFRIERQYFYSEANSKDIISVAVQHEIDHMDGVVIQDCKAPSTSPLQVIRKEAKVGRNDPCPCGSNKKYKKCCGK